MPAHKADRSQHRWQTIPRTWWRNHIRKRLRCSSRSTYIPASVHHPSIHPSSSVSSLFCLISGDKRSRCLPYFPTSHPPGDGQWNWIIIFYCVQREARVLAFSALSPCCVLELLWHNRWACHGPQTADKSYWYAKNKGENIMLISGGLYKNYGACGNCLRRVNSFGGFQIWRKLLFKDGKMPFEEEKLWVRD